VDSGASARLAYLKQHFPHRERYTAASNGHGSGLNSSILSSRSSQEPPTADQTVLVRSPVLSEVAHEHSPENAHVHSRVLSDEGGDGRYLHEDAGGIGGGVGRTIIAMPL
jgi:hypothetical protein